MNLLHSFNLAYRTIKGNKLRTGITVAIIAFGIMALIGIITAIEAMNQSLKESFSSMGANAFNIRFKESNTNFGGQNDATVQKRGQRQKKSNLNKVIRKEDAEYFKANFNYNAKVAMFIRAARNVDCHYEDKKTNPVCAVWGGDENYIDVVGYKLLMGRNINNLDVQSGRSVCVVGSNIVKKLFNDDPNKALDKILRANGMPYRIVGVLKEKGSSLNRADDIVLTGYNNARKYSTVSNTFLVGVLVNNVAELEPAIGQATQVFRAVRKLQPIDADNFVIEKSDKFAELFIGFLSGISGSAGVIGLITLIGAAIGLMNIMLVAVNERTREIGLIKAIGGKRKDIRQQFLFESMIISLLGALIGILLGVGVGNLVGMLLKTGFLVPWGWVIAGVIICSVVGLLAGLYPAIKASKLDPIVALRFE
ncbi:MAG: ABC transporter permease [Chitinophagaceae bacterium]|jgi:putative ABC transport system permease protein